MNFIIYEDEKEFVNKYKNIIAKLLGPTNFNYEIIEINEYTEESKTIMENIESNKIYLLDIEVPGKNGIELARKIRDNGDWVSPIIIITSHDEFKNVGYTGKILMLNFISKNNCLEDELYETLKVALEINMTNKSLCYANRGELYQILYQDILYVEKSLNDNMCYVVTKNNIYAIRKTIKELEKCLSDDINFMKTHRSCIVNLKNIKYVDFDNNVIAFTNKQINLLSRSNKKNLKERMKVI